MMDSDVALAYMGLRPHSPHNADSSDAVWLNGPPPVPANALSATSARNSLLHPKV